MTNQQIYLSDETRAQLARLPPDALVTRTVHFEQHVIGVCIADSVPSQIVLPAGLSWHAAEDISVGKFLSSAESSNLHAEEILTLRLRARFSSRRSATSIISLIESPSSCLVMIDGHPLKVNTTLGETLGLQLEKSTRTKEREQGKGLIEPFVHAVSIFLTSSNRDEHKEAIGGPRFNRTEGSSSKEDFTIDVIAHLSIQATSTNVRSALAEALKRYMHAISQKSLSHQQFSLQAHHFAILGGGFGLTYLSPTFSAAAEEFSEKATAERLELHKALALPENKALLRYACATFSLPPPQNLPDGKTISFDGGHKGRLSDVHLGIKSPIPSLGGPSDVTTHLISGHYLYCHYQQDNFDDSGWGCAYRSLQTILSWYVNERYLSLSPNKRLPSHADIQRALVSVGDKASSFVGSREWIGANEVCYALEELSGVQSRILHVSSGSFVASERGRELASHFDTQGSPVMIGGGVQAWTLLGIARNGVTGKCRFLILDPHYEGRDILDSVQAKGWVGWKGEEIFDGSAFYNFCLPQRPNTV